MIYVVSDIHGHFDEFMEMLKIIDFKDDDELYVLGDCIDKGPKSIDTLLYCLEHDNIHMCLGNHEFMMYQYLRSIKHDNWYDKKQLQNLWFGYNFGRKTYDQYMKLKPYRREQIYRKLYSMPISFSEVRAGNKLYYLVHSCPLKTDQKIVPCVNNCTDDEIDNSVWSRYVVQVDGKTVIHGHTICYDESIHFNQNEINIDCGAAGNMSLGCLRLDDMKEYYIRLSDSKNLY